METLNVYSSAPVSTAQAIAFLNLASQDMRVVVRPLSELPAALAPNSRPRSLDLLRAEWQDVTVSLVLISDQLNDHETGRCRLDAGVEQGLRYDRDTLQQRQQAIEASMQALKGGQNNG